MEKPKKDEEKIIVFIDEDTLTEEEMEDFDDE